MKKILSYLVAISASCTFSFRKMEESGVFKHSDISNSCHTFISTINKMDENAFDSLYESIDPSGLDMYCAYIYDPVSKYGFINYSNAYAHTYSQKCINTSIDKIFFYILRGNTYLNSSTAKKSFGLLSDNPKVLQLLQLLQEAMNHPDYTTEVPSRLFNPQAFFIDVEKEPEAVKGVKYLIEKTIVNSCNPLHKFIIRDFKWDLEYTSPTGIRVNNTIEGTKLTKTLEDGHQKTIDFQDSLEKYLQKQKPSIDSYAQPLIKIIIEPTLQEVENKAFNENILESAWMKDFITNNNKRNSINKQQNLLKGSEILAIWHVASSQNVDENKQSSSETIIGIAIDKESKTTFHWVTELEGGLNVLFED